MIFSPALTNGQQIFQLTGGVQGLAQVTYACASYPSAGTVTLEYQPTGSSIWVLAKGNSQEPSTQTATAQAQWEFYASASQVRLTFTGVTGGSSALLAVSQITERGFPPGVFEGNRALNIQTYTETNVKRGVQFETSSFVPTIAAAANVDVIITTGSLPVTIKNREIATTATTATYTLYKNPTATLGTAVPIYNLNANPAIAQATQVAINLAGVTTSPGNQVAATVYIIGSAGNGQAVLGTFDTLGIERQLAPNTTYLARFTNTGAATCSAAVSTTYFEGITDLPLS